MLIRRNLVVYVTLAALWVLLMVWQAIEHARVVKSARAALINRAIDSSTTLGLVMRSQRRFGGVVTKERLESALKELITPDGLQSVALLNADGGVVASVGAPLDSLPPKGELRGGEYWGDQTVTLENLVDLGTNITQDLGPNMNPALERTNLAIVMLDSELRGSLESNRPPPPPPEFGTNGPPPEPGFGPPPRGRRFNWRERPFWMKEDEYKAFIQKKGVHGFILVMSTQPVRAESSRDVWLRSIIGILASISVVSFALVWRGFAKTSELQIRLVRASELNLHLKAMNLAAAGLAHETRNPLNIIRGLAQMISKQKDASPEVRAKTLEMVTETDRVAAQLNEFINYSRPREVRRAAVNLTAVAGEVVRALNYDIEEKKVVVQTQTGQFIVEADEQLLRQALFNLTLNAIQAVPPGGEIVIRANKVSPLEANLEVADNGPGVASENRAEVFKPYFTTHSTGTGLGLAIVQQIVLAHGWEVQCLENQPAGALFRISHLKLMVKS